MVDSHSFFVMVFGSFCLLLELARRVSNSQCDTTHTVCIHVLSLLLYSCHTTLTYSNELPRTVVNSTPIPWALQLSAGLTHALPCLYVSHFKLAALPQNCVPPEIVFALRCRKRFLCCRRIVNVQKQLTVLPPPSACPPERKLLHQLEHVCWTKCF